jgi:hypothetical protein
MSPFAVHGFALFFVCPSRLTGHETIIFENDVNGGYGIVEDGETVDKGECQCQLNTMRLLTYGDYRTVMMSDAVAKC